MKKIPKYFQVRWWIERGKSHVRVITVALAFVLALPVVGALAAETPKHGGVLTFVVASYPPSFDGHRKFTFAMLHPTRPFYNALIRVNPDNPSSPTAPSFADGR